MAKARLELEVGQAILSLDGGRSIRGNVVAELAKFDRKRLSQGLSDDVVVSLLLKLLTKIRQGGVGRSRGSKADGEETWAIGGLGDSETRLESPAGVGFSEQVLSFDKTELTTIAPASGGSRMVVTSSRARRLEADRKEGDGDDKCDQDGDDRNGYGWDEGADVGRIERVLSVVEKTEPWRRESVGVEEVRSKKSDRVYFLWVPHENSE